MKLWPLLIDLQIFRCDMGRFVLNMNITFIPWHKLLGIITLYFLNKLYILIEIIWSKSHLKHPKTQKTSYTVTGERDVYYTVNSNKYLNWGVSWSLGGSVKFSPFCSFFTWFSNTEDKSFAHGEIDQVWQFPCLMAEAEVVASKIYIPVEDVLWWPQLHRWQKSSRKTCGLIRWSISTMLVVLLWQVILFIYFIVLYIFILCTEISHCRS